MQLDLFEVISVDFIERIEVFAIDVEDGDDCSVVADRHDDLAFRFRGTGYVSGELMDVRHDERFVLLPGCTANTFSERDAGASDRTLERTKYEFVALD